MSEIILPLISIVTSLIGLSLGIILGSLLGKVGSLEILAFILRIPVILIKSPKELKSRWRIWQELRGLRKIECLKRIKEINTLKNELREPRDQIKKIKAKIRRARWEEVKKNV